MATEHRPVPLPPRSGEPAVPAATRKRPALAGLKWSDVWQVADGGFVQGDRELPIDKNWRIAARLFLCPTNECAVEEWVPFPADGQPEPPRPCCPRHPVQLIEVDPDPAKRDPVTNARERLAQSIKDAVARRRQATIDAAIRRVDAAKAEATRAAKRTAADMHGHVPSLTASAAGLVGALVLAGTSPALLVAAVGAVLATMGTVVAYLAAYAVAWFGARRAGEPLDGKKSARSARATARHIASGVLAAGVLLMVVAVLGVSWLSLMVLLPLGAVLAWAVNRRHWESLWATRRRLRELAQRKVEDAAQRAAEVVEQVTATDTRTVVVNALETPEVVGRRMAADWERIARSDTLPAGFLMRRTRIVPEETREVTAPDGDNVLRIGWEFTIESEPGALVARLGGTPPLVAAGEWLAAMLGRDPSTTALVDRPDGQANRGLLILTDTAVLGGTVAYKGRAGIRRGPDGTLYGHVGRTLKGDDVEKALWTPGQPGGGGRYGHSGCGKSVCTRLTLLNDLYAGIFTTLYDPKNFVDFSDFIGIIPMGCTREHRDVIQRSLWAECVRRQQRLARVGGTDRHHRVRPMEGAWSTERDGPPLRSVWEEFHMESQDKAYIAALTTLVRVQRATASMVEVATQGGGLADVGDSVLRGLLNSTCMEIYRMPDSQARLAGYAGTFPPSGLPRIPGVLLMVAGEGTPAVPMRTAFVTREDVDGSVYDHLYAPDGSPLLTAPKLPKEMVEVFEREGLMDLWRLGQGPNGMTNLLGATFVPTASAAGLPAPAASTTLTAADVVLAIAQSAPGSSSLQVSDHPAWLSVPAGGKPPVPSTMSRAATKLEADGLITRAKVDGVYVDYRVTEKGRERALGALAALSPRRAASVELTPAEVEHQAEIDAEAREFEGALT